jgi:hypothetical protein
MKAGVFKFEAGGTSQNGAERTKSTNINEGNMNTEKQKDENGSQASGGDDLDKATKHAFNLMWRELEAIQKDYNDPITKDRFRELVEMDYREGLSPEQQEVYEKIEPLETRASSLEIVDAHVDLALEIARRKMPLLAGDDRVSMFLDLPKIGRFPVGNFSSKCANSRQMHDWLQSLANQIAEIHRGELGPRTFKNCEELIDCAIIEAANRLPDIETPEMFLAARMEPDPFLIDGLLRENSKMSMTSQSKGRKTWLQIHQALCVGSGSQWLGHETKRSPVLYVNLELKRNTLNNRVFDICEKMGIDPVNGHSVDFWNLRGRSADIAIMVQRILKAVASRNYKLVYLDPAYKCLGDRDENAAGDITDFQNHVERVCTEAKASIVITGHTPKGDMSKRNANDLQSGSGVWARDPDVIASFLDCDDQTITEKQGDDVITIRFSGVREDKTPDPFAAKWEFPMFRVIKGVIPQKKEKVKPGPKAADAWELARFFKDGERLTHAVLKERAEREGIKGGTFQRRLIAGVESGCLEHDIGAGEYYVDQSRVAEVKALNEKNPKNYKAIDPFHAFKLVIVGFGEVTDKNVDEVAKKVGELYRQTVSAEKIWAYYQKISKST